MQLQTLYIITLAGLGAATDAFVPTTIATTVCQNLQQACGAPPTATMRYGGCHDAAMVPRYTPPPCPIGGSSMTSCTSTGTVCDDRFKTCGSPTPTATISYGACHDACVTLTYSEPPCPTPTGKTQ
ncbi:hypothetical protein F4808DRAFT_130337 [Astrocystis sublimbata]|nr:hypothetical protein F4808DRAFT_130337 [Astrocystis sublimbata]